MLTLALLRKRVVLTLLLLALTALAAYGMFHPALLHLLGGPDFMSHWP